MRIQAHFPKDVCIHHLFEGQVAQTPEAVAIIFQEQQITYGQLNAHANQLAHHLQTLGVGPEVLVGLCLDRSVEMVVGLLAILKAGGAYLPLDPTYPHERLAFMLEDAQVTVLLTQAHLKANFPTLATTVCLDADWPVIARLSTQTPAVPLTPDNLAYVIYTSGSTGKPKGVLVPHRGLCNVAEAQVRLFKVTPQDHVLQFASLSFDAATFEMVMALRVGATLCLGTPAELLVGEPLVQFLQKHAISIVTLTPSTLAVLPPTSLPHLRIITVAGEACHADLVDRWAAGRQFYNLYGPTEATIWATAAQCAPGQPIPPIGAPLIRPKPIF